MTSFELITCLPSALSCTIMRDWLSLKSVVALDSAFCCRSHRSMFLDLVQSEEYYIREQVVIHSQRKILNLLHIHGEKLRSIVLKENSLAPAQEELLVEYCHNLTRVRFGGFGTCTQGLVRIWNDRIILVDLPNTYLEDITSWQIPLCPHLTSLGLSNTSLNDQTLTKFVSSCPNVVHLDVAHNDLTDSDVLNIVTHWKFLRGLNIVGCASLTNESLVHIYTHCASTLHTLHMNCRVEDHEFEELSPAPLLTSTDISELLERCTQLRTFCIQASTPYGADDIQLSPTALRNITTLILGVSVCVGNIAHTNTNALSMNLQTFAAYSHHKWDHLLNIVRNCSNLQEVFLSDNVAAANSTALKINALKTYRPGMEISSMYSWEKCAKHFVMNM